PKGVMVTHRSLCNLAEAEIPVFAVDPDSRVLQYASLSFDASVSDLAIALGAGASLYLGSSEELLPGLPLLQFLRDQAITHVTLTPTTLSALPAAELPALRTIAAVGEVCPAE